MFTARYGLDIYIKFKLILTLKGLTINPIRICYFIRNYSKSGKSLNVSFLLILVFFSNYSFTFHFIWV